MVVKAFYTCGGMNSFGFYSMDSELSIDNVRIKLENWFKEMTLETGLSYELQSFEIISKCVIQL